MSRSYCWVLWVMVALSPLVLQAQAINEIPVEFDQTIPSLTIYNPGYLDKNSGFTSQLGYKGFNSLSNNLRTFYSNFHWVPNPDKGHSIGLDAFSDQEGKFIQHTRVYGKYAYAFPLSTGLNVCFGVGIGVVNYQVKNNVATAGFSDSQIDAKIGGHLYSERFSFGASILQFLDQTLVLNKSEIVLKRYYQGFLGYDFVLNDHFVLEEGLYARYATDYPLDFRVINKLLCYEKYYANIIVAINQGTIFGVGLEQIEMKNWELGLGLSYRITTNKSYQVNTNALEITMSLHRSGFDKGVTKEQELY